MVPVPPRSTLFPYTTLFPSDTWVWYGWTIWAGERQRWLVYATFGHTAASLDAPVKPAEDERDNISNVTLGRALVWTPVYVTPRIPSSASKIPQRTARLESPT